MENTPLRFALCHKMHRMKFGDVFPISDIVARKAWPPTGDADRSVDGAFRALSLALSGNRPETSMTTLARIRYDLDDETFTVDRAVNGEGYVVRRPLSGCICRGSGFKNIVIDDLPLAAPTDHVAMDAVLAFHRIKCDHVPPD